EHNTNIEKLIENLVSQQSGEKYRTRFLVKQGHRLVPVSAEEISYFYTEDKVVFIRTKSNNRYIVDFTLDELEKLLEPKKFFRANRQFILNNFSIQEIHSWFNGKLKIGVHPKAEEEVIISREKAGDFKAWMGE
ncbi:MAG: LytR/AlgR family response regulator transcription factor, partial [Bacteroidia bacterium]